MAASHKMRASPGREVRGFTFVRGMSTPNDKNLLGSNPDFPDPHGEDPELALHLSRQKIPPHYQLQPTKQAVKRGLLQNGTFHTFTNRTKMVVVHLW